jgi:hypothetical protein
MIEKIVSLKPIEYYINEALKIIEAFLGPNGKKYRLELRKAQLRSSKQQLKIIVFNQTRWLSRLNALKRLLALKAEIQFVALSGGSDPRALLSMARDDRFWNKLNVVIIPMLECFGRATNLVQANEATLLTVNDAMFGMKNYIENCKLSADLGVAASTEKVFKTGACAVIEDYLSRYIASTDHHAYHSISLLTDCKVSEENYSLSLEWLCKWGADFLLFYSSKFSSVINFEGVDNSKLESMINRQFAHFEAGSGPFSMKSKLLNDFTVPINDLSFKKDSGCLTQIDWKLFWSRMTRFAAEISIIALCLLSIGVSEAVCERSFSLQGLTHSKIRNRMKEDVVEAELRIKMHNYNDDIDNMYNQTDADELSSDED